MTKFIYIWFVILLKVSLISGFLEGLYCGKDNCYDILNVTRDSTKNEIAKKYRLLARKYHPDLHRTASAKKAAEEQFKIVANAYEILRDDEARTDYDFLLDNPEEYYYHYYRYYRRRVAPRIDIRIVLFVTITIISLIQHFSAWQRYDTAIKYFMTVPKYRNKALDIAAQQRSEESNGKSSSAVKKSKKKLTKAEQKEETENKIRKIIEENMDIKGAYAKPEIKDILWIQLIISPYTVTKYFIWYTKWIWHFTILKRPYGEEEKLYLIRKYMKMGQHQFNAIEESKVNQYLKMELWKKDNFLDWQQEQEEEMKKNLADNPRYKAYRRYMKNHGPGRMTFED